MLCVNIFIIDITNVLVTETLPGTILKLSVNQSESFSFQILPNFWILDTNDLSTAIGAKLESVDRSKLHNLSTNLTYIATKIFDIAIIPKCSGTNILAKIIEKINWKSD